MTYLDNYVSKWTEKPRGVAHICATILFALTQLGVPHVSRFSKHEIP
jgi:hypothetical protein